MSQHRACVMFALSAHKCTLVVRLRNCKLSASYRFRSSLGFSAVSSATFGRMKRASSVLCLSQSEYGVPGFLAQSKRLQFCSVQRGTAWLKTVGESDHWFQNRATHTLQSTNTVVSFTFPHCFAATSQSVLSIWVFMQLAGFLSVFTQKWKVSSFSHPHVFLFYTVIVNEEWLSIKET